MVSPRAIEVNLEGGAVGLARRGQRQTEQGEVTGPGSPGERGV